MKFIKDNSYDITKFFIFQIGIAIFSLLIAMPLNEAVADEHTRKLVQLGVSVLAIVFYCILVYTVSWEHGAIDRIRIDGGKIKCDPIKGMKLAVLANIPNFIMSAVAIVASLLAKDGNAWASVLGVLIMILGLIESMYLGTVQFIVYGLGNTPNIPYLINSLGFFLLPLLIVATAHIGYTLGDKNIKLFGFVSSAKNKKSE